MGIQSRSTKVNFPNVIRTWRKLYFRISPDLDKRLKAECKKRNISMGAHLLMIFEDYYRRLDENPMLELKTYTPHEEIMAEDERIGIYSDRFRKPPETEYSLNPNPDLDSPEPKPLMTEQDRLNLLW